MRRAVTTVVLTILALFGTAVLTQSSAQAYPTTPFGRYYDSAYTGYTEGSFTWYNRSVGIQGVVFSFCCDAYWTQARFEFYQSSVYLGAQTRTTSAGIEEFGWVQEGPPGGINKILIYMCNNAAGCQLKDTKTKP